jgi:hypothetical protein
LGRRRTLRAALPLSNISEFLVSFPEVCFPEVLR